MNMHRLKMVALSALVAAVALVGRVGLVQADTLDKVFEVGQAKTAAAQASQKKVDKLADDTRARLQDYKTVLKEIEGLKVYIRRLEKQIDNQNKRIANFEEAIANAAAVKRQILPLVEKMINSLEEFVAADMPFHLDERQERIQFLRDNLNRSDLTDAEKFRQVVEAYKIENEYGRFTDTYKDKIEVDGVEREVNVFRVGRIALMYQTTDTNVSGAWDQANRQWVKLDSGEFKNAILKGIRIAQKQASIDILKVPVQAPEAAN
jgi:hypothetical protein